MRKVLTSAVAALVLLGMTAANAATTTFKIKQIDAASRTVTLTNGKQYVADSAIVLDGFKAGDLVKITFTTDASGKNLATSVAKL